MKKYLFVPLILILSAAMFLIDDVKFPSTNLQFTSANFYTDGILKSEFDKVTKTANYDFDVIFSAEQKKIYVKENIVWINKTKHSTKEIHLHLYPNAYSNNNTLFAKEYPLEEQNKTRLDISKCEVNGLKKNLEIFWTDIQNENDSTVAKISLEQWANPGDTLKLYFEYSLKIPVGVTSFGSARGRNFFFISQWFPKVGVFENGSWVCSQYHPNQNFYSNFGDYKARIVVPKNYKVAATGVIYSKSAGNNTTVYNISQSGVHDFAWAATDEILERSIIYTRKDGTQIQINAFVQPERENYFERYFQIVKDCLRYFEENIGIYPYKVITLADVPRTSASCGMAFPTLFTVSAELFARKNTGLPEYLVTHQFSHQYFQGLIANNEVYEAWLDEGFASYTATKIMYKYHSPILENFKVAQYVPIFGLNFLSYNDIPIIYILSDIFVTEGTRAITNYYENLNVGTIADTSYKLPTRLSYAVNSYNKPELMLLTLERYLGEDKMMMILKEYYELFKYKHPKAEDFISIVNRISREDMNWFFDEFYRSSKSFDYRVTSVKKTTETEYEVLVERLGDGVFKTEIALVTDKNTQVRKWDGKEKWKIFKFTTVNKVIAAEIDPDRKNLLDINFANNSYTLEEKSYAALSISSRWFFWVQNALMILGSIG
ncbi:MAG: Peptidase M1 membrane alanine aminopeptidase [Ignavibacteria bacterium]|nr:MAG: Peptidase M1 membrane alanine aminopeptidase [Ignavibacteria bacterium]KAF0160909.1 MAG: Peptidase M1 membrane alanine aminopeptidase [Ignavibacteria bacterium]